MKRSSLNELLAPVLDTAVSIAPDNEVAVLQELPVETLYLALKEADNETVLWFFQNALPEQVQGLIDIDCWDGADFQLDRYDTYFKTLTLLSPPKLAAYMKQLDPEVIVRGILDFCDVLDYDPQNPPEVEDDNYLLTLDNKYVLIMKKADPDLKEAYFQWLNKFSAADIELLRRHLESAKWEVASDLEEFGYRMKKGRLEEMGFVDYHDAIELYGTGLAAQLKKELLDNPLGEDAKFPSGTDRPAIDSDGEDASEIDIDNPSLLPKVITKSAKEKGFVRDALSRIDSADKKHVLLMEILRTVNASLAADRVLHSELKDIEEASERARSYLELGLLYISDGDIDRAAQLLTRQSLANVYRLGWLTVQDLGRAATELKKQFGSVVFGAQDEALLEDLTGKRHPILSEALLKDLGLPTFPTFEGVLKVGTRLAELSEIARFAWTDLEGALNFSKQPLVAGESLYSRLMTLLFRQTNGGEASGRPITADEWRDFSKTFDLAKLERAADLIAGRAPEKAQALFKRRLKDMASDVKFYIGNNPQGKIPDSRFFKALNFAKPVA